MGTVTILLLHPPLLDLLMGITSWCMALPSAFMLILLASMKSREYHSHIRDSRLTRMAVLGGKTTVALMRPHLSNATSHARMTGGGFFGIKDPGSWGLGDLYISLLSLADSFIYRDSTSPEIRLHYWVHSTKNSMSKLTNTSQCPYCLLRFDNNRISVYCICSFPPPYLTILLLHVSVLFALKPRSFSSVWRRNSFRRGQRRYCRRCSALSCQVYIFEFLE